MTPCYYPRSEGHPGAAVGNGDDAVQISPETDEGSVVGRMERRANHSVNKASPSSVVYECSSRTIKTETPRELATAYRRNSSLFILSHQPPNRCVKRAMIGWWQRGS